jgi:hypothetical protein
MFYDHTLLLIKAYLDNLIMHNINIKKYYEEWIRSHCEVNNQTF